MVLRQCSLGRTTNRGDLRRAGVTLYGDAKRAVRAAKIMRRAGEKDAAAQFLALAAHLEREAAEAFGGGR